MFDIFKKRKPKAVRLAKCDDLEYVIALEDIQKGDLVYIMKDYEL